MSVEMKYIKKGTRVLLRNGWEAEVLDNLTNRATRLCKVYGQYEEMGSVYSDDIAEAFMNGQWEIVTHSAKALKMRQARQQWGF